jgi:HAD superfamily hydrolase (TIGR01549 family)
MYHTFEDIDVNEIKGVLLDLDDTLYSYEECNAKSYYKCKMLALAKYNIAELDFELVLKDSRKNTNVNLYAQAASHSRLLYFHNMHEALFGFSNPSFALEMEEMYWSTFLENMKLTAKAKNFLELLKTKDLPSCIVTDLTTQIQMKKWQILGLNNYINYLVTSEEAGVEKPNARIFEIALSKLKLSASEVIMIGDNEKKDFLGAQQIGIKAYLIRA